MGGGGGGGAVLVRVASGRPQPQEVCPHPEYASRQLHRKRFAIWLILLSGLSCKPDVLSSSSTLTDVMRPRSNMEPGRDKPASHKNDWKSGHPHACQMGLAGRTPS